MPRIVWPQQPTCIREACRGHGLELGPQVSDLLGLDVPPPMTSEVARAFLRCFYAARDLGRAERDLRSGGPQTEAFAARAMARRVAELRRHLANLTEQLASHP